MNENSIELFSLDEKEQCIICHEQYNLIRMECYQCKGIHIHFECLVDLQNYFDNKCPICRNYLKYHIIPVENPDDESIDNDELHENEIDIILDNLDDDYLSFGDEIFIIINKCIIYISLLICYLILSFIIGTTILIICCLMTFDCNKILIFNQHQVLVRSIVGLVLIIFIKGLLRINRDNNRLH
jgi:hypothetical protein